MRVSSTVLFMNGQPVGYLVQEREGRRLLHPAESPDRNQPAPVIEVSHTDGRLQILGTEDPEMIAQVLEELQRLNSIPNINLSAAP